MADKFLNTGGGGNADISNGSVNIFAATLSADNLVPSKPIKTNSVKQLVSTNLEIADINNLQSELDNSNAVLKDEFVKQEMVGNLKAPDFETAGILSVETAIIDLQNSGSGDVNSSTSSSRDKAIVRFDGNTGKIIKGYTNNSLAPIVSDDGFMTVFNNFNQEREDASGLSVQSIYGDQPYYSGAMDFRSYSSKSNSDNISNNRVIGRVQFLGGSAPSNRYTGCRIQSKAIQNWTSTEQGSDFVIQTIKENESVISDRLKIDKDGDVVITDNLVAQDLYISGTRQITQRNNDGLIFNETNYATQGISVSDSLIALNEKTIKLTNTGDITGAITTDITTFTDDQEIVSKKYVNDTINTLVSDDITPNITALEAKTTKLDTDGNINTNISVEGDLDVSGEVIFNSALGSALIYRDNRGLGGSICMYPTGMTVPSGRAYQGGIAMRTRFNNNNELPIISWDNSNGGDFTYGRDIKIYERGVEKLRIGNTTMTVPNIITCTDATQSTPPTHGSIITAGGLGVSGDINLGGDVNLTDGIKIGDAGSNYNGIKSSGKINNSLPDPNLFADEQQMMRWSSGNGTGGVQNNNIFELYSSVMLGEQDNNRVIDNSVVLEVKSTAIFNDTEKSTVFKFLGNLDCQEAVICRKNVSITEELLVSGDIGRDTQKVPNIHCTNIFYTEENPILRATENENVSIGDTFNLISNKLETKIQEYETRISDLEDRLNSLVN